MDDIPFWYKDLLSNLNGFVNSKDLDSRVTSVDTESAKMLGLRQKDIIDKKYDSLGIGELKPQSQL